MSKPYSLLMQDCPPVETIDPTVPVFINLKTQLESIKTNLNRYHNKIGVVNTAREYFIDLSKRYGFDKDQCKWSIDDQLVLEQYQIKHLETDIVMNIKTFLPTAIIGCGRMEHNTIEQMNRSIEQAKPFFGVDFMLSVRQYCFNLISSATDHRFECWTIDNMFSFKFSVPIAKLEIDFLIIKQ